MMRAFSALLIATIVATAEIATAQPQLSANAQAAVAEALYSYSASGAATDRSLDARIVERRREIDALRAQVHGADTSGGALAAQLAAEQQSFLATLAERDSAYARELAVFRGAIEQIASDSAGLAALERFNRSDELGALTALDRIREARNRARQVRDDLQSAAEGRRIAVLAREAQERGRIDLASVIARYEEITRLDPRESYDWLDLGRLYVAAGRYQDAERAAQRADELGLTDWRRGRLNELRFDAAFFAGDLDGAQRRAAESVALSRRIVAEGSARQGELDPDAGGEGGYAGYRLSAYEAGLFNLTTDLERLGSLSRHRGDLDAAAAASRESLEIRTRLAQHNPSPLLIEAQAGALVNLANLERERGNFAAEASALTSAVALTRPLVSQTPVIRVQLNLATALANLSQALAANEDHERSGGAAAEALQITERLYASDPANSAILSAYSMALVRSGEHAYYSGNYGAAAQQLQRAREMMRGPAEREGAPGASTESLAFVTTQLAAAISATGDHDRSLEAARDALQLWQQVSDSRPNNARVRENLAFAQDQLGFALNMAEQQPAQAIELFDRALTIRGAENAADDDIVWSAALWSMHGRAYASEYVAGDLAVSRFREGYARSQRVSAAQPSDPSARRAVAWFAYDLWRWGELPRAEVLALWDSLARDRLLTPTDQSRYEHLRAQTN